MQHPQSRCARLGRAINFHIHISNITAREDATVSMGAEFSFAAQLGIVVGTFKKIYRFV